MSVGISQVLTQQQQVLEKGASFPDGDSGESARLRQILLTHENHLQQSLQRLSDLNTQLAGYELITLVTVAWEIMVQC